MIDWSDLKDFVSAGDETDEFVTDCFDTAEALIAAFIGEHVVPAVVRDRCVLNVGAELYHAKDAPNGVAQFSQYDNAPIRIARDPLVSAYKLLTPFMVIGL